MSTEQPSLADRLADVVATARTDIEVTRDLFEGEPSYILRDPLSQSSHRLAPTDYEVFCRLDDHTPLATIFAELLAEGHRDESEEESFYEFVIDLHRAGLLNLPIVDDAGLYERHRQRRRQAAWQRVVGFLFMKVPLFAPDRLLDRTIGVARVFFSRIFVAIWALGVVAAVSTVIARRDELENPISAITQGDGAFGLLAALVALKVIHEFGHAWACKLYGGRVPVMGAMFVVFAPLAYVDASAAWGFENRRQRIVVNLAGMYFESIVAIAAVFVWANTAAGFVNSLAYQVILLASVVTIGFNANPLMRFDGYYVLSDWLGVPNLRERASRSVANVFDRIVLGLPRPRSASGFTTRLVLFSYGVSSVVYKFVLVLGICTMIALKSFYVGLALAAFYLTQTAYGALRKVTHHLYVSPLTAPARTRAMTLGTAALVGLPLAVLLVPVAIPRFTSGVVHYETETPIRVSHAGFLVATAAAGHDLDKESLVARVETPGAASRLQTARAEVRASEIQAETDRFRDPARSAAERVRLDGLLAARDEADRIVNETNICTPVAGRLVSSLTPSDIGRWLETGTEVGRVVSGEPLARFFFAPETLEEAELRVGDPIDCRSVLDPEREWHGEVARIAPAASRFVNEQSLTQLGGGDIVVDPANGTAANAYIAVDVRIPQAVNLPRGVGLEARLFSAQRPLSAHLVRAVVRFADEIRTR